jgi:hypothetical protein
MPNSYQWAVNTMTAYPEVGGMTDVVFQVAWVCSATDGINNTATYGSVDLTLDPSAPFTPYADLTLDQVLGWVFGVLGADGTAAAETKCDEQLAAMASPATVTPPLPWGVNPPAPVPPEEP